MYTVFHEANHARSMRSPYAFVTCHRMLHLPGTLNDLPNDSVGISRYYLCDKLDAAIGAALGWTLSSGNVAAPSPTSWDWEGMALKV